VWERNWMPNPFQHSAPWSRPCMTARILSCCLQSRLIALMTCAKDGACDDTDGVLDGACDMDGVPDGICDDTGGLTEGI